MQGRLPCTTKGSKPVWVGPPWPRTHQWCITFDMFQFQSRLLCDVHVLHYCGHHLLQGSPYPPSPMFEAQELHLSHSICPTERNTASRVELCTMNEHLQRVNKRQLQTYLPCTWSGVAKVCSGRKGGLSNPPVYPKKIGALRGEPATRASRANAQGVPRLDNDAQPP